MPGELEMCNKDNIESVPNYCNTTPYSTSDGKTDGDVRFILVDCETNALLPMDQQPAEYAYPGVSTGPNRR